MAMSSVVFLPFSPLLSVPLFPVQILVVTSRDDPNFYQILILLGYAHCLDTGVSSQAFSSELNVLRSLQVQNSQDDVGFPAHLLPSHLGHSSWSLYTSLKFLSNPEVLIQAPMTSFLC